MYSFVVVTFKGVFENGLQYRPVGCYEFDSFAAAMEVYDDAMTWMFAEIWMYDSEHGWNRIRFQDNSKPRNDFVNA